MTDPMGRRRLECIAPCLSDRFPVVRARVPMSRKDARLGRRQPTDVDRSGPKPRAAMSWVRRLKRVFRVDVETCQQCGGAVRIIASTEVPDAVERILGYIERRDRSASNPHAARGPPAAGSDSSGEL